MTEGLNQEQNRAQRGQKGWWHQSLEKWGR
jgi:hypothetical protein